ncbi:flavohemoprotein [Rhodococcus rhodnii LMG 5362]|uniref:nitric oxide dioxygenase n=1 Tax=Rhodococcus rhodnii LMG 5362 TaxID=1273125 RepID=R7WQJ9_9NOCA|nr:flavohemoprotein [Rhodococcus rhodnii LMG 5362]
MAAEEGGAGRLSASFYSILFAENPTVRELFPAAMDVQRDRLVAAIGYVVDHLDTVDDVLPFVTQLGRDHRKYGIDESHYRAVGSALLTALGRFECTEPWTDDTEAAWSDAIALLAGTMIDAADAEAGPATTGATVIERREVLADLVVVRLRTDAAFDYTPGQYVSVQIPSRPRMWRYLSMATPPNDENIVEFHVRRVSGGWVSPAIVGRTEVGERWQLSSPIGDLGVPAAGGDDMLMVGAGTGVAPLRAQILDMAQRRDNPRVHLFVTGVHPSDLYCYDELAQIELANPWLTVTPVSERDDDPWWVTEPMLSPQGMRRRITGQAGKIIADYRSWTGHDIQVSGSPGMVNSTLFRLRAAGIDNRIRHDPLL